MQSMYNGYSYIVDIYEPNEIPPAEGFPVIIVLDGTRYNKLMYETMAMQLRNRKKHWLILQLLLVSAMMKRIFQNSDFMISRHRQFIIIFLYAGGK